jgi:hypothetical protein
VTAGSVPGILNARTQQTFWNPKGLTPTSHLEITPKHAEIGKSWVFPFRAALQVNR